jgi:hypothetical protein
VEWEWVSAASRPVKAEPGISGRYGGPPGCALCAWPDDEIASAYCWGRKWSLPVFIVALLGMLVLVDAATLAGPVAVVMQGIVLLALRVIGRDRLV